MSISGANGGERKRTRLSRYATGGSSLLQRQPWEPGDGQAGDWSREQLERMDARFCRRLEKCFRLGHEQRASASACVRARAGDGDRFSLAS
jgi:hypothetical protein